MFTIVIIPLSPLKKNEQNSDQFCKKKKKKKKKEAGFK